MCIVPVCYNFIHTKAVLKFYWCVYFVPGVCSAFVGCCLGQLPVFMNILKYSFDGVGGLDPKCKFSSKIFLSIPPDEFKGMKSCHTDHVPDLLVLNTFVGVPCSILKIGIH